MIVDYIISQFHEIFSGPSLVSSEIPRLSDEENKELCQSSVNVLSLQSTVIHIKDPVVIIGDIHGSLDDLMRIIKMFGKPPETNYLFLGDYVDRGSYSLPVIQYLLALICKYPSHVWLLRGNHEFSHINRVYGFFDEMIATGSTEVEWEYFQEVFYYLPLAAIVLNKIFCVHGGLSPSLININELEQLKRPIPNYINMSMVSDLVWSDPVDEIPEFAVNQRGSGVLFGHVAVRRFLNDNKLQLIVRGHQCTANGVHAFANAMGVTVFSCSDYSGVEKNKCGAVQINSLSDITIYSLTKSLSGFTKETVKMMLKQNEPGIDLFKKKKIKTTTPVPQTKPLYTNQNSNTKDASDPPLDNGVSTPIIKRNTTKTISSVGTPQEKSKLISLNSIQKHTNTFIGQKPKELRLPKNDGDTPPIKHVGVTRTPKTLDKITRRGMPSIPNRIHQ